MERLLNPKAIGILLLVILSIMVITRFQKINVNKEPEKALSSKGAAYQKITPEKAKERMEKEKEIVLLDVRTEGEYREKHIPQSVLVPLDVIEKDIEKKVSDKNTTLFVYCRSGNRSQTASRQLIKMGYTNVFDLGGIMNWPYETEQGSK